MYENRPEVKELLNKMKNCDRETEALMDMFGFSQFNVNTNPQDSNVLDIEVVLDENSKLLFSYLKTEGIFLLNDMIPQHRNFKAMQQFLFQSQDISGFMAHFNLQCSQKSS